jgi:hypothetical protein
LTSAVDGGEWSASQPSRFIPRERAHPISVGLEAAWAPEPVWTRRFINSKTHIQAIYYGNNLVTCFLSSVSDLMIRIARTKLLSLLRNSFMFIISLVIFCFKFITLHLNIMSDIVRIISDTHDISIVAYASILR